ncbi:hypothetical protein [Salipiger mangrovisoli]|uniref:Uncharacterized protein n=1 Tax=Salipiger mangrovisoli TaxID=2865933 RepID=A0ABR9WYA9_9RHOB|nr:hypothetical protein [Salipiger mangrovisoli]MBE9636280.1 hypothetical protein [Salipiger mangrovisoli]
MTDLGRRTLPYLFLILIAVALTCWVRPATDVGYKALFLASFAALSGLWLIGRLIAARLR